MGKVRARTAQQRDARELALTRPADPYRGALTDPFTIVREQSTATQQPPLPSPSMGSDAVQLGQAPRQTPRAATFAGVIGIALGLTVGLFGLLLLTILSIQSDYGAPDRSFYRGTDAGYVVLALINFGLAACCAVGGIMLMTGRVTGRIVLTVGGWAALILSGYWLVDGTVRAIVPIIIAIAAATMLFFGYQRVVTLWLGVLQPPQPE